jgi:hypothetical protein
VADHYLVMVRCLEDDIVIRLFYDIADALRSAQHAADQLTDNPQMLRPYLDLLGADGSDPIAVSVLHLRDREPTMLVGSFATGELVRELSLTKKPEKKCHCKEQVVNLAQTE